MSDFDLDSIKKMIGSVDLKDRTTDSFSLDDIIKDFGCGIQQDLSNTTELDTEENTNIASSVIKDTKQISISDDIEKPDGFSLTGAFEAIANDKNISVCSVCEENESCEIDHDVIDTSLTEIVSDKEIHTVIERQRFFDTETFNSIKDKTPANIKASMISFANGEEESDDGEEAYYTVAEPTEEIDDFNEPNDREDIIQELKKILSSASVRTFFTFVFAVISTLLFSVSNGWISLPGINADNNIKTFAIICIGIYIITSIVNARTLANGIKSLLKGRVSVETYIFLVFVFNTIINVMFLISGENEKPITFDFLYVLMLFFYIYSKKAIAQTIYKNFLISSADGNKSVINRPDNEEALNDIMVETGCVSDVVYASKTEFVSDFIHNSFKDFELKEGILNTVFGIIIFALAIIKYISTQDALSALIYITAALCVTMPLLCVASFSIPLYINSKKARKLGGIIIGSSSSEELKDVQTVIVDDADVFKTNLNGIRLYGDSCIDDAILYLNSLYSKVGGPLKSLFSEMLSENISSLPRIDEIYYHENMGYSGLIHSKTFVAGNKSLMDHFGVDVDDNEYEILYQQKSRHVLFVAYDGKLMGVFLLSYSLLHGVSKAFEICEKNQIAVCIAERDPAVNKKTLFDSYKAKDSVLFNIISFRVARKCFDKFDTQERSSSLLISNTGLKGLMAALRSSKAMRFAHKANRVISVLSSFLALPLITFLLFFSDPSASLQTQILVYHLLWSLPMLFVSIFSK